MPFRCSHISAVCPCPSRVSCFAPRQGAFHRVGASAHRGHRGAVSPPFIVALASAASIAATTAHSRSCTPEERRRAITVDSVTLALPSPATAVSRHRIARPSARCRASCVAFTSTPRVSIVCRRASCCSAASANRAFRARRRAGSGHNQEAKCHRVSPGHIFASTSPFSVLTGPSPLALD